jgi:hypothetical protein
MTLFQSDPDLRRPEHQLLREQMSRAWATGTEWS